MSFLRLFLNVMSSDGESEYLGSERESAIKYACRTLEVVYMYLHTLLQYYAFAQSASHLSWCYYRKRLEWSHGESYATSLKIWLLIRCDIKYSVSHQVTQLIIIMMEGDVKLLSLYSHRPNRWDAMGWDGEEKRDYLRVAESYYYYYYLPPHAPNPYPTPDHHEHAGDLSLF